MNAKIYILECADDCWYIGKTSRPNARLKEHIIGTGAVWTKMHPVVRRILLVDEKHKNHENELTRKYMAIYGIDKVRGGDYCMVMIPPEVRRRLELFFHISDDNTGDTTDTNDNIGNDSIGNLCYNCGRNGHFAAKCAEKADILGTNIEINTEDSKSDTVLRYERDLKNMWKEIL